MHWQLFLIFLVASAGAASTGMLFPPGAWYEGLRKPGWTPPRWAFPTVWTFLYLTSAFAASRVAGLPGSGMAMAFWAMQIAFNTLWTPMFFGLGRMKAALIPMGLLWLAVAGMLVTFWPLDWLAGLLVVPYILWVSIAAGLNLSIVRLNPHGAIEAR